MPLADHRDCMLIVIDVQPGFYPAGELSEADARAAEESVRRAAWLTALSARLGVPTVVTEEDAGRHGGTDERVRRHLGAEVPVFPKPTFAVTGASEIAAAVRSTGRPVAVLAGWETDVCVAQSAVGLLEAGMRVVVVEDATFSPGEMHGRGLARAAAAGAELNHCKGLAYEWVRTVEGSRRILDADPVLSQAPFRL